MSGKRLVELVGQKRAVGIPVRNVSGRRSAGRSWASGCVGGHISAAETAYLDEASKGGRHGSPSIGTPPCQYPRGHALDTCCVFCRSRRGSSCDAQRASQNHPWMGAVRVPGDLITGLCEFAGAAALVTQPLRHWAGVAFAVYAACVWPANFKHAIDSINVPHISSSWWFHAPRLAFRPVIIWWRCFLPALLTGRFKRPRKAAGVSSRQILVAAPCCDADCR